MRKHLGEMWNDPNRIDWAIHFDCANQISCIHTVQGLEMEYVGVIFGKDLSYNQKTQSLVVRRDEFKDKGARLILFCPEYIYK